MMGSSAHLLYLYRIYTISTGNQDVLCIVIVIRLPLSFNAVPVASPRLEFWKPTLGGLLRRKQFGLRQHILATLF